MIVPNRMYGIAELHKQPTENKKPALGRFFTNIIDS
jgi:hypothetical protein